MIWMLASGAIAAECPTTTTAAALDGLLGLAEEAFADLDVERFSDVMDEVTFYVPCVADPLTPKTAAHLHRMQALRQFVARDERRTVAAIAAARSAAPTYALSDDIVPAGHVLYDLYGQLPLENGSVHTVAEPVTGSLRFDGVVTLDRPTSWPTIVQVATEDGSIASTDYLFPQGAMPTYEAVSVRTSSLVPMLPFVKSKPQLYLLAGSAVALLGAGAMYGAASVSAAGFDQEHPEWSKADLDAHRGTTNTLVVGSAVAAVAGAGGLTVGLALPW